jgi:hypothetical protein
VIASIMVSCNSYQTRILQPYFVEKPFTNPHGARMRALADWT